MNQVGRVMVCVGLLQGLGACTSERVIGVRCPGPLDPGATVEGPVNADTEIGTGCPPCDGRVRLDKHGCPTFVTGETCGGDVCVGPLLLEATKPDASVIDGGDGGGSDESDAGGTEDGDAG